MNDQQQSKVDTIKYLILVNNLKRYDRCRIVVE